MPKEPDDLTPKNDHEIIERLVREGVIKPRRFPGVIYPDRTLEALMASEQERDRLKKLIREVLVPALGRAESALCDGLLGGAGIPLPPDEDSCRLSLGYANAVLKNIRAALAQARERKVVQSSAVGP